MSSRYFAFLKTAADELYLNNYSRKLAINSVNKQRKFLETK